MNADVSRTDDNNARGSGWTPTYLFHGVWVCLGLAFVWLAWNTYHTYHSLRLVWSFVTPAVILAACLGMWHTLICRRHYQHLLSSMQRSERERTERVLQESAAHYWDLFENASDFIYTLDMQRHFTSTNKAAERLLGYTRDELVGMDITHIATPESIARSRQMRLSKQMGLAWTTYEVELITKAKRHVPIEVSTRLIYRDGEPVGIQGIGRDITERKLAEEALKQARDELELRVAQRTADLRRSNEKLLLPSLKTIVRTVWNRIESQSVTQGSFDACI